MVKSQNNLLEKNDKMIREMYSTDDSASNHITVKYNNLKKGNWILFIIYYILLVILLSFMIFSKGGNLGKIVIFLCFGIFPFVIYPMEDAIYKSIMKSYS